MLSRIQSGSSTNITGPDGASYTGVFRAARPDELAVPGLQMTSHGFEGKTAHIVSLTRDQFSAEPLAWRGRSFTRTLPEPVEMEVVSVNADEFFVYLVALARQNPASAAVFS